MNSNDYIAILTVSSVITGYVTEALKRRINASYNQIAGIISIVLTVGMCVMYYTEYGAVSLTRYISTSLSLCLMSWLASMLGYDKVVQMWGQIERIKKETGDEADK